MASAPTIQEIISSISTCNTNCNSGISRIPIQYYQGSGIPMQKLLHQFFDLLWKYRYIDPILRLDTKTCIPKFKPADMLRYQNDPTQYRPIAVQNTIFKIFDNIIRKRLEDWVEHYHMLEPNQGGFCKKIGCPEQIFILQQACERFDHLQLSFLDIKKAYDSVDRSLLIQKLQTTYKLPTAFVDIISSIYMISCSVIRNGNIYTTWFETERGLHQGALSSPILFNMYIDQLIKAEMSLELKPKHFIKKKKNKTKKFFF